MNNLSSGISANIIFAFLVFILKILDTRYRRFFSKYSLLKFILYSLAWLSLLSCFYFTHNHAEIKIAYLLYICLPSIIYFYLVYREINQYYRCGIIGATNHSLSSKDYDNTLRSINYNLVFLGIGASKLTRSKEFLPAMKRCADNKTIKFLLLNPSHKSLITASLKADKAKERYEKVVVNSLSAIAKLKENGIDNIEVRLYNSKPIFRLMYIDQATCLLSGYYLGDGDGANLPQVYIKNDPQNPHSSMLFNSYEKFYDIIWKDAKEWNFKEYI